MSVADRVCEILAGRRFLVAEIDEATAEVTYDPPGDRVARQRLHEIIGELEAAGLTIELADMGGWTPGLRPGMSSGTRTPPRARRIAPGGPPRLVVRER